MTNSIFNSAPNTSNLTDGNTILENVEVGFRFNRLYNGTFFVNYQGRASSFDKIDLTYQCLMLGLRTSISNEYFDF